MKLITITIMNNLRFTKNLNEKINKKIFIFAKFEKLNML